MVKRAFSEELNKTIKVEYAHALSLKGKLNNPRSFKCPDKECNINLTCTNWRKEIKYNNNDKRLYFRPSSLENLHISGCSECGENEEKQRSTYEKNEAKTTIQKNGLVVLKKIYETKAVKNDSPEDSQQTPKESTTTDVKSIENKQAKKYEGSHITSILSLIDMYNDDSFDKSEKFLKVSSNKVMSLEEFFIDLDATNTPIKNQLGVYFGKATIKTFYKNEEMVEIKFNNSIFPPIYTNKDILFKSYYGKRIKKYVDSTTVLNVYFRGHLDSKWHAYNKKAYKDLYFTS